MFFFPNIFIKAAFINNCCCKKVKLFYKEFMKELREREWMAWMFYSYILINGYLARKYFDEEERNLTGMVSFSIFLLFLFIEKSGKQKKTRKIMKTSYSVLCNFLTKFRYSNAKHIVFLFLIYILYFHKKKTQPVPSYLGNEEKELSWKKQVFIKIKRSQEELIEIFSIFYRIMVFLLTIPGEIIEICGILYRIMVLLLIIFRFRVISKVKWFREKAAPLRFRIISNVKWFREKAVQRYQFLTWIVYSIIFYNTILLWQTFWKIYNYNLTIKNTIDYFTENNELGEKFWVTKLICKRIAELENNFSKIFYLFLDKNTGENELFHICMNPLKNKDYKQDDWFNRNKSNWFNLEEWISYGIIMGPLSILLGLFSLPNRFEKYQRFLFYHQIKLIVIQILYWVAFFFRMALFCKPQIEEKKYQVFFGSYSYKFFFLLCNNIALLMLNALIVMKTEKLKEVIFPRFYETYKKFEIIFIEISQYIIEELPYTLRGCIYILKLFQELFVVCFEVCIYADFKIKLYFFFLLFGRFIWLLNDEMIRNISHKRIPPEQFLRKIKLHEDPEEYLENQKELEKKTPMIITILDYMHGNVTKTEEEKEKFREEWKKFPEDLKRTAKKVFLSCSDLPELWEKSWEILEKQKKAYEEAIKQQSYVYRQKQEEMKKERENKTQMIVTILDYMYGNVTKTEEERKKFREEWINFPESLRKIALKAFGSEWQKEEKEEFLAKWDKFPEVLKKNFTKSFWIRLVRGEQEPESG